MPDNFFEYKAPQYVSAASPLDVNAIHGALQEKQQRADQSNVLFTNLMSQLGEEPTRDPQYYDEAMKNIKGAFNELYTGAHGDLSGSYNKMVNLIGMAKADPFWTLNKQKVEKSKEMETTMAKIRATGKEPLVFQNVNDVPLIQNGNYTHPDAFQFDVQEPLDYETRMHTIWQSILTHQGGEGKMHISTDAPGMYESTEWSGISPQQFGHKKGQAYSMYKNTDEYKQQKKLGLNDDQIKQQFEAIGQAMTTDAITSKPIYRDIPGWGKNSGTTGHGRYGSPSPVISEAGGKAFSSVFSNKDLGDLYKSSRDGSPDAGVNAMGRAIINNDPKVKEATGKYIGNVRNVLLQHASDPLIKKYPLAQELIEKGSISPDKTIELQDQLNHLMADAAYGGVYSGDAAQFKTTHPEIPFAKLTTGLVNLASKAGNLMWTGLSYANRATDLAAQWSDGITGEEAARIKKSPLAHAIYKAYNGFSDLSKVQNEALDKIKQGGTSVPIYHLNEMFSSKAASDDFNEATSKELRSIPPEEISDASTGKTLDKGKYVDYQVYDFLADPNSNKVMLRVDLYDQDKNGKAKVASDGANKWITIDNPKRADDFVNFFDMHTNNAFTNAINDTFTVTEDGGLRDKSGKTLQLEGGFKANRVDVRVGDNTKGHYYTVTNPKTGKPLTEREYLNMLLKSRGEQYLEDYMREEDIQATDLDQPHPYGNTTQLATEVGIKSTK